MTAETAAVIKGGTMIAASGIAADMAILNDHIYLYLAITGGIVSMLGVFHEVFGHGSDNYTIAEVLVEVVKGIVLGVIAIPFWFLVITEGIMVRITGIDLGQVSSSLALIISFVLSWYTVPIFEWIVSKVKRSAK